MAELHTSCQHSGDDSSIATDLQTLPASNVRSDTLSPGFEMNPAPNNNPNDQRLLREFVVELMWLASVNAADRQAAARSRRLILRTLYECLDFHEDMSPNSDVRHNLIYGTILIVNSDALTYLSADLVVNLRNALNERNSANLYARRYQFISILRDLQSPSALASVLPGQQGSPSDLIQQFLQGDFDALRQIEPGELLNRLAANPAVLHQLLAMPDEPGIAQEPDGSSGARAGNSNDFSQGPTAEQDRDGLA